MKNYIEMFMNDNNLKAGEKFNLKDYPFNPCVINDEFDFINEHKCKDSATMHDLMLGFYEIEKIKPKTLMEQLKEQGFGWVIACDYLNSITTVEKINLCENYEEEEMQLGVTYLDKDSLMHHLIMGLIYLTESEAEREAYRRKLEFDMQEWARENECLDENGNGYIISNCFRIILTKYEWVNKIKKTFRDKLEKYYNWNQ